MGKGSQVLFALAALAALDACGSRSRSGGATSVTVSRNGGAITMTSSVAGGSSIEAVFISAISPEPTPLTITVGNGTCVIGSGGGITTGTVTYARVGTNLSFTDGSTVLSALLSTSTNTFFGGSGTALPGGSSWIVANSGGSALPAQTIGTLTIPDGISISGTPTVVAGQKAPINWAGGGGAAAVDISVLSIGGAVRATCSAPNTGTFDIPANVTTAVGSGATVSIDARTLATVTLKGREMLMTGFNSP